MTRAGSPSRDSAKLPRASLFDTLRASLGVLLPIVARGTIARRPRVMALEEKLQTDDRGVRVLQHLRARYGPQPLRLRVFGRSVALVLSPDDVRRVLAESPEPFALANREKRGALSHFQPGGVLISHGGMRADRRHLNETVLDADLPVHRLAGTMVSTIVEEGRLIGTGAGSAGRLGWDEFITGWWRIVRRVVLGEAARDDHEITDVLTSLRSDANWSYLRPKRTRLRERFLRRLDAYLDVADPATLAGLLADTPAAAGIEPAHQVPQWLFASDPAGMVTFRTLALLATHPEHAQRAREELGGRDLSTPQDLPYLRACVLESVRLWPTTPIILRDSTVETTWTGGIVPARTAFVILAPFFHRDEQTLPYADRFEPEIWLDGRADNNPALVPFSAGPGACPGRNLMLYVSSTLLATLIQRQDFQLTAPSPVDPPRALPRTLNNFALRFAVTPRDPAHHP